MPLTKMPKSKKPRSRFLEVELDEDDVVRGDVLVVEEVVVQPRCGCSRLRSGIEHETQKEVGRPIVEHVLREGTWRCLPRLGIPL
jgi:hypothetical protein